MNEDALVEALAALVGRPASRILTGIGDDAAVWQPSRAHRSVITTDALVEGVHFTCDAMSPREIGHRAMVANLSDVAAMGARSHLATVALSLPPDWTQDRVLELYRGMLVAGDDAGVVIAGGDLTRAPILCIAITVVGEVRPSNLKLRSGAKPGDVLCVTGPLGASRAGLLLAKRADGLSGELRAQALRAHRTPQARWREGLWFGSSRYVHAMMDVSDGLATDLARLCERSRCGALIASVPVAPSARAFAEHAGEQAEAFALAGGEDFELLVAIAGRAYPYLANRFKRHFGRDLFAIGEVRAGNGVFRRSARGEEVVERSGWEHF